MSLPETASAIEIIWTAVGILAVAFGLWATYDADQDLRLAREALPLDVIVLVVGEANLRRAILRLIEQVLLLGVGAFYLFIPPAVSATQHSASSIAAVVLLIVHILIALNTMLDRIDRSRAIRTALRMSQPKGSRV